MRVTHTHFDFEGGIFCFTSMNQSKIVLYVLRGFLVVFDTCKGLTIILIYIKRNEYIKSAGVQCVYIYQINTF